MGSQGNIHLKILQRMRQVLLEQKIYRYLGDGAIERLQSARLLAQQSGLEQHHLVLSGGNTVCIFPWLGTVTSRTLARYLEACCHETIQIEDCSPYYIKSHLRRGDLQSLLQELKAIRQRGIPEESLVADDENLQIEKYDEFIPRHLLRKAFAADHLRVDELATAIADW